MLKQMREGAKSALLKTLLFGLLLLAMAGLALMDVQGMFRRGVSSNTVARIGKEKLTAPEFDRMVQMTLRAQQIKQNDAYRMGLPQQILRRELDSRLFSMAARDLGLLADDTLAAQQVKEMLAPLVAKGMTEKEALQRFLQANSLSEPQLVASLKEQISLQYLMAALTAGAHAPRQMVDDSLKYRHEWRRGEYFTLTAADAGALRAPSEEELKAYYDTIATEYNLPEYRTLTAIVLDKNSFGEAVKISEDKVKQYYEDNGADYRSPETRVIAQAVVDDEAAAQKIYEAAAEGKDLQKAIKAAGKGSYLKPGTYTENSMFPELARPAFSAQAGQFLAPVKSPMAWHVLHVEKINPPVVKPFASVKAEIEGELLQEQMSEAVYEGANKIDDEIAGGKTLSEVAREHKIRETVLEKIDARGVGQNGKKSGASLPLFEKVVDTGFRLKKGAASPLIEAPDGSFVIVSATDIFPPEQQPFGKVRGDVLSRWKQSELVKALADKSAKVMEQLKTGASFDSLAKEFRKDVKSTAFVQRAAPAAKSGLDKNLAAALFSLDQAGQAAAVSGDGSITVIRLAGREIRTPADSGKDGAGALEENLTRSLRQDLLEQYRAHLMAKYKVVVNDKLLSELYAPKDGDEAEE